MTASVPDPSPTTRGTQLRSRRWRGNGVPPPPAPRACPPRGLWRAIAPTSPQTVYAIYQHDHPSPTSELGDRTLIVMRLAGWSVVATKMTIAGICCPIDARLLEWFGRFDLPLQPGHVKTELLDHMIRLHQRGFLLRNLLRLRGHVEAELVALIGDRLSERGA